MESTKPLYTLLLTPTKKRYPNHPPQIMETDIEIATLGNMRGLKRRMESEGNFVAKIAKVVVSELDNVDPVRSSVALLLPDDERVDVLLNKLTIASPMEGSGEDVHNMCRAEKRLIVLQWIRTL